MRLLACLAVCSLVVSGCTEQSILRYQDRPAQTALECEAAYQAARQRGSSQAGNTSSGASVIGAAIGTGLARGMIDSAYRQCLVRVANTNGASAAQPSGSANARERVESELRAAEVGSRPTGCPANAPVFYGGTQYCIGRR